MPPEELRNIQTPFITMKHFISFVENNIDNEKLSDEDFREVIKATLSITQGSKEHMIAKMKGDAHDRV